MMIALYWCQIYRVWQKWQGSARWFAKTFGESRFCCSLYLWNGTSSYACHQKPNSLHHVSNSYDLLLFSYNLRHHEITRSPYSYGDLVILTFDLSVCKFLECGMSQKQHFHQDVYHVMAHFEPEFVRRKDFFWPLELEIISWVKPVSTTRVDSPS